MLCNLPACCIAFLHRPGTGAVIDAVTSNHHFACHPMLAAEPCGICLLCIFCLLSCPFMVLCNKIVLHACAGPPFQNISRLYWQWTFAAPGKLASMLLFVYKCPKCNTYAHLLTISKQPPRTVGLQIANSPAAGCVIPACVRSSLLVVVCVSVSVAGSLSAYTAEAYANHDVWPHNSCIWLAG